MQPDPSTLSREEALFMAKAAEQAERYEEMVKYMKRIVSLTESGDEMSGSKEGNENRGVEERNLISVGYKNMMSVRRTAFRMVQQYEEKAKAEEEKKKRGMPSEGHQAPEALVREYKEAISKEVFALIKEVIDDVVLTFVEGAKAAQDPEVLVFFRKMQGDYNRYGAEITQGDARTKYKEAALAAYQDAEQKADNDLPSTNPIRLGLALNFSVFYYEICEEKDKASSLAKKAFDDAIDHLDTLSEEAYKDSTLIMQLLKDNLTLWIESSNQSDDDVLEVQEVDEAQ